MPSSSLTEVEIGVEVGVKIEVVVKVILASFWHERAAFQRSSFGRSRSGGRLLAMT